MESCPDMSQLKIAKITKCTGDKSVHSSLMDFKYAWKQGQNYYYREREPTVIELYPLAMRKLEEARAEDLKVHTANGPGLVINKIIVENICAMMKQIGMPEYFKERDHKSRARTPKYNHFSAGYITDIQREIVRNDGYEYNVKKYDEYEKSYKEQHDKALKEIEVEKKKVELEEKKKKDERKANLEIAALILRYSLPEDSDWSEIYDALIEKDKYLDLANAMLSVRNDWNDGPDRVGNALGRFKVENETDKEIATCINEKLDNWDNDGRVFRDCVYNYDYLFARVNPQLLKDYQVAKERAFSEEE